MSAMAIEATAVRVMLVDDQAMIGEAVRRMLANEPDIAYKFCSDPGKAMAVAAEFQKFAATHPDYATNILARFGLKPISATATPAPSAPAR